jgi:S-adenosyl-l-methionine hydroxide adenosyltransferase
MLIDPSGRLKPVLKIITDYPRDDLAHDEVQQALVTACMRRGVDAANIDVGSVPGMDTVVAGFKTAQLAMNSQMGFGHIVHANCAPRKNISSAKSAGEKVVLGITKTGVALLVVNAGYALAPFRSAVDAGDVVFYQTDIKDAGSQFRSRDYFPDAMAELAAHFMAATRADGITEKLRARDFDAILKGLSWLGGRLNAASIPQLPQGMVLYVDNFGNLKLNFRHEDVLAHYKTGTVVAVKIGNIVVDAVIGGQGFSQGEGMLALTAGSSGWDVGGTKSHFTEIMLRGGSASRQFGGVSPGDRVTILREDDLQRAMEQLHSADMHAVERLDLRSASVAQVVSALARAKLVADNYDSSALQKTLDDGGLLKALGA